MPGRRAKRDDAWRAAREAATARKRAWWDRLRALQGRPEPPSRATYRDGLDREGEVLPEPTRAQRREGTKPEEARRPSWIRRGEALIGARIDPPCPITARGTRLATSVWGRAWCEHLERYSDFRNRLPRGRTYLRGGRVLHLAIEHGVVRGVVEGRSLYGQTIRIETLDARRRAALERACGTIDAAVDLISGRLPAPLLEELKDPRTGLFPEPKAISLSCSCPDWAYLCKHLAAVLYGVGVRLDDAPHLLFSLRGVDPVSIVGALSEVFTSRPPLPSRRLHHADLGALFDIEIDSGSAPPAPNPEGETDVEDDSDDGPLLATRQELLEVGVPATRIQYWLRVGLLLPTDRRAVYEITPDAWDHLEPLYEV